MSSQDVHATAWSLSAVADAAVFTADMLFEEAYDPSCSGVDQMAQLAVARGWRMFAQNCLDMSINLQEELEAK